MADDEKLEIVFVTKGASQSAEDFADLGKGAEKAAASVDKLSRSTKFVQGPNQRMLALLKQRSGAQSAGNIPALKDIDIALARTQKQLSGAQPKSFGTKLGSVLRSSRIGSDGGLMPLVGGLVNLLGPEGTVFGLVGEGCLKAAEAIGKMTEESAQAANGFSKLQLSSGGTGGQTAMASTLGAALGMSPGDVAGMVNSLQSAYTSDPLARSAAAQAGVSDAPGAYGKTNRMGDFLKIGDKVRSFQKDDDAIRYTRMFGAAGDQLLQTRRIGPDQWKSMERTAGNSAGVFTDAYQKKAADYTTATTNLQKAIEALTAKINTGPMGAITKINSAATDRINSALEGKTHLSARDVLANLLGPLGIALNLAHDGGKKSDPVAENTAALKENTKAVQDMAPGIYGHGANVSRAMPSAFGYGGGYALQQQHYMSGALSLGTLT